MNKIININLAGRLIPIDELAYDTLRDYLNRLKAFFSREDGGDEILRDMEDRIGELFQDKLKKGASCIMPDDVSAMMSVMGSPEEIEQETAEEEPKRTRAQEAAGNTEGHAKGRLTRSKKDSLVGGVCGGTAHYFKVDPVVVRLAFVLISLAWGTGILVYLLLWALLPLGDYEAQPLRRRLYRNPQQKVVGGVCSGIAAYLNIDPVIPRIVFAAPLLGMVFFSILDDDIFFFPLFTGGLPTLVLLYIILWASLPVATTVAEKLEMRGEKVDVQNLSLAMKGQQEQDTKVNFERASGIRRLFGLLIKIFVFFVLAVMLVALSAALVGTIAAVLGLTSASIVAFPLRSLITDNPIHQQLLWISLLLVLLLPFFVLMRLLVGVVSGRRKPLPKWVNLSLTFIFIAAFFSLFWIAGSIANDFKSRYRTTDTLVLTQPYNDTLIIKQRIMEDGHVVELLHFDDDTDFEGVRFLNDSLISLSNINLIFTESPDSLYHLLVHRSAYGKNTARAKTLTTPLQLDYMQEGNVLYLPYDFNLPAGHPFRGQKMNIEVRVPRNKVFKPERLEESMHNDFRFKIGRGKFKYEKTYTNHNWQNNRYHKMGNASYDYQNEDVYED